MPKAKAKQPKLYRQGDVYLFADKLPAGVEMVKPSEEKRHVLAYGETTGHAHAFYDLDAIEIYQQVNKKTGEKTQYIKALKDTQLLHGFFHGADPDHSPIPLKKGEVVRVVQQRQYNYATMSAERVAD